MSAEKETNFNVGQTTNAFSAFDCLICIDTAKAVHLCPSCARIFCGQCISIWLRNSKDCPHCRKSLAAKQLIRLTWLDDFLKKSSSIRRSLSSTSADEVFGQTDDTDEKWVDVTGDGIKPTAMLDKEISFTVQFSGSLGVETKGPAKLDLLCDDSKAGFVKFTYTPKLPGKYEIKITCDGVAIPDSPFKITVDVEGRKADLVKAYGPGIERGRVFSENKIYVDYRNAGLGNMALVMEGPTKAKCKISPTEYGISEIVYTCNKRGTYKVFIRFAEGEIPGSPFSVEIR